MPDHHDLTYDVSDNGVTQGCHEVLVTLLAENCYDEFEHSLHFDIFLLRLLG